MPNAAGRDEPRVQAGKGKEEDNGSSTLRVERHQLAETVVITGSTRSRSSE